MSSKRVPRIFVVDDEHVIASTLAVIFNRNGYSARCFTRPIEAMTAAQSDIPDLLVSDIDMPGISGVDLAVHIRERNPKCKILLFSGQEDTQDLLENARKKGRDFHLLLNRVHPAELLATPGRRPDRKDSIEIAGTTIANVEKDMQMPQSTESVR